MRFTLAPAPFRLLIICLLLAQVASLRAQHVARDAAGVAPTEPDSRLTAPSPQAAARADLTLLQSAERLNLSKDEAVSLRLELQNRAASTPAQAVVVHVALGAGLRVISNNCSATIEAGALLWQLENLPARSRIVCQVQLLAVAAGNHAIQSRASAAETDAAPQDNQAQLTLRVSAAQLPWSTRLALSILAGLLTFALTLWMFARKE
jgi:hypothetical protein